MNATTTTLLAKEIIHISTSTFIFIIQQAYIEIQQNTTPLEKCLLFLFIYEFIKNLYKIAQLNAKTRKIEEQIQMIMTNEN